MRHPERNCHNDEGLIKRGIARRGRVCLFERSREGEGGQRRRREVGRSQNISTSCEEKRQKTHWSKPCAKEEGMKRKKKKKTTTTKKKKWQRQRSSGKQRVVWQ